MSRAFTLPDRPRVDPPEDLRGLVPMPKITPLPQGVSLVPVEREHSEALNALFNRVFGQERPLAHFLWKFWENPAGPPVGLVALADDDGRVLAANLGLRKRFSIQGRESGGVLICESASDPDYPSGGRLYRNATIATGFWSGECNLPISFGGQSTDEAIRIGERWFGYRVLFSLQPWRLRLSLGPALRRRFGAAGAWAARALDPVLRSRLRRPGAVEVLAGPFTGEFDAFFERVRGRYPVLAWRDRATLSWRYARCPVGRHRTLVLRRGGRMEGYLIYRDWVRDGVRLATVLDLLDGRDSEAAEALLCAAARDAAEQGCAFLEFCPMPGSTAEEGLRRIPGAAPVENERPDHIIVTPLPRCTEPEPWYWEVERVIVRAENWYYTQGDCDYRD